MVSTPGVIIRNLLRVRDQHFVKRDDIRVSLTELVAGAITADHYVFRHRCLSRSGPVNP